MLDKLTSKANYLLEHYVLYLLFCAVISLTIVGVGNIQFVSMLGLLLCMAGFFQRPGRIDWWIMAPILVYLLIGAISFYIAAENVVFTYTAIHAIYPVLYLLMSSLASEEQLILRRLCVLWTGYVAAHGIVHFLMDAMHESAGRLGGMMSNPNSMGIFLVVGWFGLMAWMPEAEETGLLPVLLRHLEPLLLMALALTLSMGSFLALAVGMTVRAVGWVRQDGWREAANRVSRMLAKAALCVGAGILMYFIGRNTSAPWLCLGLVFWLVALMLLWENFDQFLLAYRWFPWAMVVFGAAVAAAAVTVRPSAGATFLERLDMMRNALGYLTQNPLLGVGPYQWRRLNMADSDIYFNTWHIHNIPLHIGVELGWIALAAVLVLIARTLRKHGRNVAGFAAYLFHNLMDTSFFYLGTTTTMLFTVGEPERGGRPISAKAQKLFFAAFALLFLYYRIAAIILQ